MNVGAVTDQLRDLSEPQFPHQKKGLIKTSIPFCRIKIRRIKTVKQLTVIDR